MNSRERVRSAIRNEPVDRCPFDFWAEPATINRLLAFYGTDDEEAMVDSFNADIYHLPEQPPADAVQGNVHQNFWGERYIYKKTPWGPVREDLPGALADSKDLQDLKRFNWPSPDQFRYSGFRGLCRMHRQKAIMYGMADIWQRPALVRGMENALLDLTLYPDWVHFLSRKFTDFYKEEYANAYRESGGHIDIFLVISDLGGQKGPLISMSMFEEHVAPYLKEMTDHIHDLGAFVMFHSCGMIHPFIPSLIDLGVDILDPIQPVTEQMQPDYLAGEFGGQICFHGGIDIQTVLVSESPEPTIKEIYRYINTLGNAGGYICAPSHLFQPDIPPENIDAFYQAERCVS